MAHWSASQGSEAGAAMEKGSESPGERGFLFQRSATLHRGGGMEVEVEVEVELEVEMVPNPSFPLCQTNGELHR